MVGFSKEVLANNFRWNDFWSTPRHAPRELQDAVQEGLRNLHILTKEMSVNAREIFEGKICFPTAIGIAYGKSKLMGVTLFEILKLSPVHSIVAVLRDSFGQPLEQIVLTAPISRAVYFGRPARESPHSDC